MMTHEQRYQHLNFAELEAIATDSALSQDQRFAAQKLIDEMEAEAEGRAVEMERVAKRYA